jgi:membrane protein
MFDHGLAWYATCNLVCDGVQSLEVPIVITPAKVWTALKETTSDWSDDNASRLAAALSYYALLSLAPLLLIIVAITGIVLGEDEARAQVVRALGGVVGPQGLAAIETLAQSAHALQIGSFGSLFGLVIALFGASSAFVELQASLNTIWDVPQKRNQVVRSYVIERFWSFVMVLGVAALLLCSLFSSALLAIIGELFEHLLPGGGPVWQVVNFLISLTLTSLLFSVVYRVIPDVEIRWSDVWIGALGTAVLFVCGNLLLGIYLGKSGVTSAFGGAGSVVALMIWVYYSSQLVFLGAEFTQVYTRLFGSQARARLAANNDAPSLATAVTK